MTMKKVKYALITQIIFSAVVYLLVSFTQWDLLWFLQVPNWEQATRFTSGIFWITVTTTNFVMWVLT